MHQAIINRLGNIISSLKEFTNYLATPYTGDHIKCIIGLRGKLSLYIFGSSYRQGGFKSRGTRPLCNCSGMFEIFTNDVNGVRNILRKLKVKKLNHLFFTGIYKMLCPYGAVY